MRTKLIIVVALVVTLALMVVSPAMGAGQQTRILYGLENLDYVTYTPTAAGYLQMQIFWQDDAGGTPGYPVAEVDGVVQAWNSAEGEAYWDYDAAGLYGSTNPEVDVLQITADMVNKPVYVGAIPFVGDVQYRVILGWGTKAAGPFTTVVDTGAFPTANRAHGIDAKFYIPAIAGTTAPWHSVAIWPGSSSGTQYADVDDYCWNYDYAKTIANNWSSLNYYGPLVTDVSIGKAIAGDWFIAAPEVWTAAAVPNDWTGGSIYPKPGTLAYNAAPIWYTYSWGQDAGTSNTAYFWNHTTTANASRLSFSSDTAAAASISFTFYGDTLKWWYTKGPRAGIASVKVDGVEKGPVDQYNSTVQFKQSSTFTGLGNTAHTVIVKSTGAANASATGLFTYHDAFEAPGFTGDVHTLSENNMDGMTLYDWSRTNYPAASGGTFSSNKAAGAAVAFSFYGPSVTWKYIKGPRAGIANVYLDGVLQPTVDQYASAVAVASTPYSGLAAAAWHTILIKPSGAANAAATGAWTYHDAFVVGATTYEN